MTTFNSILTSLKLRRRPGSEDEIAAPTKREQRPTSAARNLQFDLYAQLSYMSSVATSGVSRAELFEHAAGLPYSSSSYFKTVHTMAKKLNVDYAEGCRLVAGKTDVEEVKSFLLRFAGAMSSGEDEQEFLLREATVRGESFGNIYERDTESLKKWADAYVTLIVAAGLIVIVAVISMMIYEVGVPIIVGLALTMVLVTCLGGWIIYVSAPKEVKTRLGGASSTEQKQAQKLFNITVPVGATIAALVLLVTGNLGYTLIIVAVSLFPTGYIIGRDDKKITKRDEDIATVVRVLGNITSAVGTTISEALNQIDKRSMGSLEPDITLLRLRLDAGINPKVCWRAFVVESGSELVDRTVTMFWDALDLGGEPGKAGNASSLFASQISFLRATRGMVAATFRWLVLPLHLAMTGLMLFIPEIMKLFTQQIAESARSIQEGNESRGGATSVPVGDLFAFGTVNISLVTTLVTFVVVVLTVANAYAPKAAEGGHSLKLASSLSTMILITGILMVIIPILARGLFSSIVNQ